MEVGVEVLKLSRALHSAVFVAAPYVTVFVPVDAVLVFPATVCTRHAGRETQTVPYAVAVVVRV